MTDAHNETGQMAVCCQNLTLGAPSSRGALSLLVGTLFTKFGIFFEQALYRFANIGHPDMIQFIVSSLLKKFLFHLCLRFQRQILCCYCFAYSFSFHIPPRQP
jgi:hypothetical protein